MEPQAECMLVLIRATPEGKKELLGFQVGVRESAQSWRELLVDLKARGLASAPELATGDGALGFWKALDEVSPSIRHQRCTVHKTANVLDKLPKSVQPAAKSDLREIWAAPDRATAEAAIATFADKYGTKAMSGLRWDPGMDNEPRHPAEPLSSGWNLATGSIFCSAGRRWSACSLCGPSGLSPVFPPNDSAPCLPPHRPGRPMRSKLDHPAFTAVLGITGLLFGAFTRPASSPPTRPELSPGQSPPAGPVRRQVADPSGTGRGQAAAKPSDIPARGWWDILKRVAAQVSSDRLLTEAAGVTFYALLAIFPALAALISLYGLVADPRTISDHLAALEGILPGGGMDIIREQVQALTSGPPKALGFGVLFGLATSLWSANQGTKALFDALNVVNDETETRGFLRRTATTLAFTVGALAFVVLAMAAVVVVPVVLNFVGLGGLADELVRAVRWPLLLAVVGLLLALIYRYGPSREKAKWRWVSWGSGFAAVSWLAGSAAFSWYVSHFGSYNKTYGSLGAAVGFMTWIWISTTIVLVGGELNAELEHQTARDTTTGPEAPRGARGASKADRVAPA